MANGIINDTLGRMVKGQPDATVGMGATILGATDRRACTVIEVHDGGKRIVVRRDHAKRTDSNVMSEMQDYAYSENKEGACTTFSQDKLGIWREVYFNAETNRWKRGGTNGLRIGERREYYDFTF